MHQRSSHAGFTLIEGIIAIGIISTAMLVGLGLAISNLTAAQANSDRIIAANLAREGIEVVRHIRDSNWLRQDANVDKDDDANNSKLTFYSWDDFYDSWPLPTTLDCGLGDPDDCGNYFDIVLDTSDFSYTLKAAPAQDAIACIADPGSNPGCRVRKNATGTGSGYVNDALAPETTIFFRRILLKPICWDALEEVENVQYDAISDVNMTCDDDDGDPVAENKIGVLVTSQVVWQRGNKTLEARIKERLYNWQGATL